METLKQICVSKVYAFIFAPEMDELEAKILSNAELLFMKYGVKSVTMDDLAKEMGMSKKTIYTVAKNKEELIFKTLGNHFENEMAQCCQFSSESVNAIEELLSIAKNLIEQMRSMNPAVLYDLKKYYPKAYKVVEDYRFTFIYETIFNNLKKGIKQGLYRKDINADIIAKFYVARADVIFDTALFPPANYNWVDIYSEGLLYHIRGIASEKGLAYLAENVKKIK
jgi:TetR/AcrR family transcriptional regulator, cholesterol catabolism regulator